MELSFNHAKSKTLGMSAMSATDYVSWLGLLSYILAWFAPWQRPLIGGKQFLKLYLQPSLSDYLNMKV